MQKALIFEHWLLADLSSGSDMGRRSRKGESWESIFMPHDF